MTEPKPLVLDVDGTFLRTDMLFEAFWAGLGRAPLQTLRIAFGNLRNPAILKEKLAQTVELRVDLLPVNAEVQQIADAARDEGREVILASAAYVSQVERLADHHNLSSRAFATQGGRNLKGRAKAAALVDAFGERGFHYAGNETLDKAIWQVGDAAILVGDHGAIAADLERDGHATRLVQDGWRWRDLGRAIRPHQWVKNLLLVLPMIAAHDFTLSTLVLVILAITSFSAAASAIYVVNDLLDLEADRLHPVKRNRPFAAGRVPIRAGMAASAVLFVAALGLAGALGAVFASVVLGYMTLSLAYSMVLKRLRWVDIFTLAALYTVRIVAGAVAGQVEVSIYMLIFVYPVFLTLGCVKRMTELALADGDARLPGRGYGRNDRGDLLNMSGLGIVGALAIFVLYSVSPQGLVLYPTTWILWLAIVPLAVWLIRMVALGYYGEQDHDPIVFAMRDKYGIGLLLIVLSLMFWAAGLWSRWFG